MLHVVQLLLGTIHKRRRNFFVRFWYPTPPCRNFDPDLPSFYLLISCNIGIWDPPPPKIFRCLLWMAPYSSALARGTGQVSRLERIIMLHSSVVFFTVILKFRYSGKATKMWKNLPIVLMFDCQKNWKIDFFNFFWPSQNIWCLTLNHDEMRLCFAWPNQIFLSINKKSKMCILWQSHFTTFLCFTLLWYI